MIDGNYDAADAYHLRIAALEAEREKNPPTCIQCFESDFSPDGEWCKCSVLGDWVTEPFLCTNDEYFIPR